MFPAVFLDRDRNAQAGTKTRDHILRTRPEPSHKLNGNSLIVARYSVDFAGVLLESYNTCKNYPLERDASAFGVACRADCNLSSSPDRIRRPSCGVNALKSIGKLIVTLKPGSLSASSSIAL